MISAVNGSDNLASSKSNEYPSTEDAPLTEAGDAEIFAFKLKPGQVVTDNCVVNNCGETTSRVLNIHSGDRPAIQLTAGNNKATSLEIVALPNTISVQNSKSTVIMPKSWDDDIKVIINSTLHTEYSMSGAGETEFPALIERDPRRVRVSTSTDEQNLRELTEWLVHQELHLDKTNLVLTLSLGTRPIQIRTHIDLHTSRLADRGF
jgi:hypothetical protein